THPGGKTQIKSAIFVGVDVKAEAVVSVVIFLFEEHVFLVVAQLFVDLDIVDIRDFLVAAGLFGIGIFEADDLGSVGVLDFFFFLHFILVVDLASRNCRGLADGEGLEIGAGIGLAGI